MEEIYGFIDTIVFAEEENAIKYWRICGHRAVPYKYFFIPSNILFLKQHLKYCRENPTCLCYWPYRSKRACEISDAIYHKMYPLVKNLSLRKPNSSGFPGFASLENAYDILTSLFIHSFLYSQYRQVLLQLAQLEESDLIIKALDEMQPDFLHLYSECLKKHPHPKIYYERGMIIFHQGKALDSLSDIRSLIAWAENHHQELLTSELYLQEGTVYAELGLYDKAVVSLSRAIYKDPNNKQAYFERATAYFELGQFDLSLEDYLASEIKPQSIPTESLDLISFSLGLMASLISHALLER